MKIKEHNLNIIKMMIKNNRAKDLYDLMNGESPYSREDLTYNLPGKCKDQKQREDELITRGDALDHVEFISKYGTNKNKVQEGGMVYSSRSEEFVKWLNQGCLGLHNEEIETYINENPFDNKN